MPRENSNQDLLQSLKIIQTSMKLYMHDYFEKYDLTPPQGMLVFLLNQKKLLKISEISEKMGLSNSTVSSLVDRLESQGLVERTKSKKDRRLVLVQLTQEMNSCIGSHQELLDRLIQEALLDFSTSEKTNLFETVRKLSNNIKNVVEEKTND